MVLCVQSVDGTDDLGHIVMNLKTARWKKVIRMPRSCKVILKCMVHKGAMTQKDHDKIVRNLIRIRCKECKYAYISAEGNLACAQWSQEYDTEVDPNGYCFKAERKCNYGK